MRCPYVNKRTHHMCKLDKGHTTPHEPGPSTAPIILDDPSDEPRCEGCGLAQCSGGCRE